jgi:hypothetical protein
MGDIRKVAGSGKSSFSTKGAKKDKDDLCGLERSGREKSLQKPFCHRQDRRILDNLIFARPQQRRGQAKTVIAIAN